MGYIAVQELWTPVLYQKCVFTYVLQQSVHCEWLQPPIHILSSCGQRQKGWSLLIVWKYIVSCPALSPRLWEQGRKWPEEALRKLVSTWKHSIVTCWPWQCMQDDCAGCRMCGIGNGTTLDAGAIINMSHATSDWTRIHDLKLWNSRSTFSPDSCESFIWCIPRPQLECPPAGMDETSFSTAYNTCAIQTQPWKVIGRGNTCWTSLLEIVLQMSSLLQPQQRKAVYNNEKATAGLLACNQLM